MLDVEKLKNKDYLMVLIKQNLDFLLCNINFDTYDIKVHINLPRSKDLPRGMFTLFVISEIAKRNILSIDKSFWLNFFHSFYSITKADKDLTLADRRYVQLFAMRFLNNLNENYEEIILDFSNDNFASVYTYCVSMGLYISTYKECTNLKLVFPYSLSIYNNCLKVMEFLLYSSYSKDLPIFAFVEYSNYLTDNGYLNTKFENFEIDNPLYSTSGILCCLEQFTKNYDFLNIKKIITFLELRKVSRFTNYINPFFADKDCIFTEGIDSQYICLDSNSHLILSLLNLYDKAN